MALPMPMAATLRIGRETLAAGLFWQPAPTAMMAAREARIVAARAELAADLFCVRKRGVPQFGLAQRKAGHRAGMRAAAPALAAGIAEQSWVGVFPSDQGWLYVMVRKGAVMPDGDLLFKTELSARERLRDELSVAEWDAIFAPPHWQIEGARPDALADLISRRSDAKLKPVVRRVLMPLLMLGLLLGGGWGVWTAGLPPAPRAPVVPDVPAPPPPLAPWQGAPPTRALIQACQRAIERARPLPGFEIESAVCGVAGSVVRYQRRGGSVAWLPQEAQVLSPDRAEVTTPLVLPAAPRRSAEERPMPLSSLRRWIWGRAQMYRLDCELVEPQKVGAGLLPSRAAVDRENASFRWAVLSLGGRLPPTAFADVLSPIPALVVEEISWQPPGWRIKGKVYVR